MTIESPRVSDEVQAAFVARFEKSEGEKKIDPERLFVASRKGDGRTERVYYSFDNLRARSMAVFDNEGGYPEYALQILPDQDYISLKPPDKKDPGLGMRIQHDECDVVVTYFPHGGEDQSRLFMLHAEDKSKGYDNRDRFVAWMPYWSEIEGRTDVDEILARGNIKYDKKAALFEARFGDMVVRVRDVIAANEILDRYFPQELGDNPFEAGVESDGWARSDWMNDFGITWNRTVEVPVFES